MFNELVRIVAATQNAQEAENKRRLLWEQEQEAKTSQKQADMEKKMLEFQSEIVSLRSKLETLSRSPSIAPTNLPILQFPPSTAFIPQVDTNRAAISPISPVSQPSPFQQPMFVQGSSSDELNTSISYAHADPASSTSPPHISQPHPQGSRGVSESGLQSITPDPSPHLAFSQPSVPSPPSSKDNRPSKRNRRRRSLSQSSDGSDSSSSSSSAIQDRPRKRISHHDTRCYTINVSETIIIYLSI